MTRGSKDRWSTYEDLRGGKGSVREMAFSRATEDLEPNVEREENIERDGKGDLDVEGARPEEDVLAGMGMCEVIVDGGKSLPSRHTSTLRVHHALTVPNRPNNTCKGCFSTRHCKRPRCTRFSHLWSSHNCSRNSLTVFPQGEA